MKKIIDNVSFWRKINPEIELEKTTHGWKVLGDYGNNEIAFFNDKQKALRFIKVEFSLKKLRKVI